MRVISFSRIFFASDFFDFFKRFVEKALSGGGWGAGFWLVGWLARVSFRFL